MHADTSCRFVCGFVRATRAENAALSLDHRARGQTLRDELDELDVLVDEVGVLDRG